VPVRAGGKEARNGARKGLHSGPVGRTLTAETKKPPACCTDTQRASAISERWLGNEGVRMGAD
jgi:hypothetical protein